MSNRRIAVPAVVASAFAILFFGLGSFLGARPSSEANEIAALRAEVDQLRRAQPPMPTGTSGVGPAIEHTPVESRAAIVEDVKRQLQSEMGLLPINMIRDRGFRRGRQDHGTRFSHRVTPKTDQNGSKIVAIAII